MPRDVFRPIGGGAIIPASGQCIVDSSNPTVNTPILESNSFSIRSTVNDSYSNTKLLIKWDSTFQYSALRRPFYILGMSDFSGGFQATSIQFSASTNAEVSLVLRIRNIISDFELDEATWNTISIGDTVVEDSFIVGRRTAGSAGSNYAAPGGEKNSRHIGMISIISTISSSQKIFGSIIDVSPHIQSGTVTGVDATLEVEASLDNVCIVDHAFNINP